MLQLEKVTKIYRTEDVETVALDRVSFDVGVGEFVAIMGPSGCGKSTLLNLLGLLDSPTSGSYKFFGQEVVGVSEKGLTLLRRKAIGFVFQSFNLIDDLTVAENVEVGLVYRGAGADRTRVDAALEGVGLAHRARHRPSQLSGGQQQRVAVARALVSQPKLILADEPTGNLDTANSQEVMALLRGAANAGTSVVMVTHASDHAAQADRTIQLLDGRVVDSSKRAA